jgi:hypothetical protein
MEPARICVAPVAQQTINATAMSARAQIDVLKRVIRPHCALLG